MPHRPPVFIPGWEPDGAGDSEPLTFEELVSELVREPFNLDAARIARLNDYQLFHVYLRPRDENGCLVRPRRELGPATDATLGSVTFREMFGNVWRGRGKSEEEIALRWEKYLEENPGLREGTGDGE